MPKLVRHDGPVARSAATTRYDAHHTVLEKTYGALADLRRELANREIAVIGKAPTAVTRTSLIRRLPEVAVANGWSAETLEVVAAVLEEEKILRREESRWLREAGPAWADLR